MSGNRLKCVSVKFHVCRDTKVPMVAQKISTKALNNKQVVGSLACYILRIVSTLSDRDKRNYLVNQIKLIIFISDKFLALHHQTRITFIGICYKNFYFYFYSI